MPSTVNVALLGIALVVGPAAAAPVDSDLATAPLGGGCYPTGITPALLDMLTLINPEWAPVVSGMSVDSDPVLIHGTVQSMHGDTSGDFPSTHLRADVNHFLLLDSADADRLATGNDDGLVHTEWEAGVYPAWAWAGVGDRLVALGRWIFDCGHSGALPGNCSMTGARQCVIDGDCRPPTCSTCGGTETCLGTHFAYSSELHPPYATAAIRTGRGAVLTRRRNGRGVPATRVDIFVSNQAGGAGDRCVLAHQSPDAALLSVECFPLAQPIAPTNVRDFSFDVPLPPRPPGGKVKLRKVEYDPPGGVRAAVRIRRRLAGPDPHLAVVVRLTRARDGQMPTGYAGTLFAGWWNDPARLTHVRVTVNAVAVHNALQPAIPVAPKTCSVSDAPCVTAADCPAGESCFGVGPVKAWQLQAAVNGEWQELGGLASVGTGDVIPEALVYDQYLPPNGVLRLQANGVARECIDTLYGRSLAADLVEVGFTKGIVCLASTAHVAGGIDVAYPGPDFGAGGSAIDYETPSVGGAGGQCSMSTGLLCVVDEDCPSGETCTTMGGSYSLRYRIERS